MTSPNQPYGVTNTTLADNLPPRRYGQFQIQLLNSMLRLVPMVAKFLLTLYMGRFFPLDDIGVYGLVVGLAVVIPALLGQRLDIIIVRDIVDVQPEKALRVMRDGFIFYGANYLLLALVMGGIIGFCMPAITSYMPQITPRIMMYILVLSVLESATTLAGQNMIALGKQLTSNMILMIRAGLWVLPVVVLCVLDPSYRNVDTVLMGWCVGSALALVASFWCWRHMPWRAVAKMPYDWRWLREGIVKSHFYWFGLIGLMIGGMSDRFITGYYLNLHYVGILTFYASFTNAMLTLMQSGVLVFSYPRLIVLHRNADKRGFRKEVWRTAGQMAGGATAITVLLALAMPIVARMMHGEAFVSELPTFYLVLAGTWLRINAELFYYVLFARHQDNPVCYGNMLFIVPTLLGGIILVPLTGFSGIGYSCILSGIFLIAWRLWFARDLIKSTQKGALG